MLKKRAWNVAIVEPHFIVCAGLSRILSRTSMKERIECENMQQLWVSLQTNQDIDLFLIDVGINFIPFAGEIERLKLAYPDAFIVLMADRVENDLVGQAVQAGVHGLIVKGMRIEAIVKSLELILMGEPFFPSTADRTSRSPDAGGFSRDSLHKVNGHSHSPDVDCSAFNLSSREVEVLMSLREGKSNKEIARDLQISDATVKVHVKAILRKLRMKNRTEAALWATGAGLLDRSAHQQ